MSSVERRRGLIPRLIAAGCRAIGIGLGAWALAGELTTAATLPVGTATPIAGPQYFAQLPRLAIPGFEVPSDSNDEPTRSSLRVFENGRLLGPPHSVHDAIRNEGQGRYSHWADGVHFSASDNSDPRSNGAAYTVTATLRPTATTRGLALLTIGLCLWTTFRLAGADWRAATKLVALGAALVAAPAAWLPEVGPGLAASQLAGRTGLTLAHGLVVVLSLAALMTAPFIASWPWRTGLSLVLLSGYVLDQAMRAVSGQPLHAHLVPVLISERDMAGTVLPAYVPAAAPALVGGLALLGTFLLPPRQWARGRRAAALSVAAGAGAVALALAAPGSALYVPPPIGVPATAALALLPRSEGPVARAEVSYARGFTPMIDRLVVVIDESVRGDVMGINDARYGNTPFLRGLGAGLVNFGVATSATNCSVASRIIMRMGLRRDQLPDVDGAARRQATIWQYAQAAGFRTSLLDAWARTHSYMDDAEFAQVGDFVFVDGEEHARDPQLPALIGQRTSGPGKAFVYVNKLGIHPQYASKLPPGASEAPAFPAPDVGLDARRAADVRDYHRAIRYSVDAFFEQLWPRLDEATAVIYTSDHGQSLYEGGYDLSHCSLTATAHRGEVRVPLFVVTKNRALQAALHERAAVLAGRADHYALFSTLLQLMGYDAAWADVTYGPSLFAPPPAAPRTFLVGTYNEPGAFWASYDDSTR